MEHECKMTECKAPFVHARITVELPFDLSIPSGLLPLRLGDSDFAIAIIVTSDPSWIIGYTKSANSEEGLLNSAVEEFGIISSSDRPMKKISEWVRNSSLDGAAIVPANTMLEIRMGFGEQDVLPDVHEFSRRDEIQKIIVFAVNQFISRYQVASGFENAAGIVGAVSLLELRHLSIQLFKDDEPISQNVLVVPSLPSQSVKRRVAARAEVLTRFRQVLKAPAVPLWLDLAHEAHSALYRGRNEQSIINWLQALEVAVSMVEERCKIKLRGKRTIESRLKQCLSICKLSEIDESLYDEIVFARRLRNEIVHEGKRLLFNDIQAERVSSTMISALAIIEKMLFKLEGLTFEDGKQPRYAMW